MTERFPISVERMRRDDDAYCEGCDNGDDGPPASAYVSVGPTWNVKHTHLCLDCVRRLYAACDAYLRDRDSSAKGRDGETYYPDEMRWGGPCLGAPDESEPAPPTDGSTLSEKTEASWYLALEESRAEVERLRAEAKHHHDKWWGYEQEYILPCFRWAAEAGVDLAALVRDNPGRNCTDLLVAALRDRVRVLESAIRKCRPTLDRASHCLQEDGGFKTYSPMIESIKDAQRAIDRALSTTQEPPASKDDHGKR